MIIVNLEQHQHLPTTPSLLSRLPPFTVDPVLHIQAAANMSTFGGPGGRTTFSKPTPPERGSFPLDHEAECQPIMKQYLRCIKAKRGVNDEECRQLSKGYLQCRMDRNLMAPDSMRNLGFQSPADLAQDAMKAKTKAELDAEAAAEKAHQ